MAIKYLVAAFTMAVLASPLQAQLIDPTGTYYNLIGKINVSAKLVNCKPLSNLPKNKIDVIVQSNNKISIAFLDDTNVRIFNDDAGRWLNDQSNRFKPENYQVDGAIFSRTGNRVVLSRRNDGINYLDGAQTLLEIERRQLRWRIEDALKKLLNTGDAEHVVSQILKLPQHSYTPTKFDMRMTLRANGTASLKESIVAETNFVIPQNPYILSGTCKVRIISKRNLNSVPGTTPVPIES